MSTTADTPAPGPVSPLLELEAAVQAEGADAGVAAHYGSPLAEQRKLVAGQAIVDLSHRGVLSVSGPDRLTWLNSMSSQELRGLTPGQSTETLLLDPAGRVEYAIALVDDGVEAWLLVEAAELAGLHAWLDRMRFTLRVQVVDHTLAYATIGSMTADPAAVALEPAAPNGVPLIWHDPWNAVTPGGYQYASAAEHPGAAWAFSEVLIPRAALPALRDAVSAGTVSAAGLLALEALRIAAWRPRGATEVDDRTIPHELDWLRTAVHLTKGCYRGQETVAKVHNLGHPPRRLVMLHLDGVTPSAGAVVSSGDTEVGRVTSAAMHYELGPIALAVVKRSTALDDLTVLVDETPVAAAQELIVPPSAGAEANVPRLPRLGAVQR